MRYDWQYELNYSFEYTIRGMYAVHGVRSTEYTAYICEASGYVVSMNSVIDI